MPDANKIAAPDHAILDVLAERYSPYAYEPKAVEREKLLVLLEAARWAASSYNEQPWRFILAERTDAEVWATALACLVEPNRKWAANAGAIIFTVTKKSFSKNDKPNRVAEHDVGLAAGNLSAQATALGLHVHQMAGIEMAKVRTAYQVPDGFDPVTAVAVGYAGDGEPDDSPRTRMPLGEWVFAGKFGQPHPITG